MKNLSTSFDVAAVIHFGAMSLKLIRIARLKKFQAEKNAHGPVDLGKLIGKSAQQTSDLLSGRASFGEKVARSIEHFAALPPNWLDEPEDRWPFPDISQERFYRLDERQRQEIQGAVRSLIVEFEKAKPPGNSSGSPGRENYQKTA